jgi:hypothetical protein
MINLYSFYKQIILKTKNFSAMKTFHRFSFKNATAFLVLLLFFTASATAQTPQYYKYNNGTQINYFPFNISAGKQIQWLFLHNDF